MEWFDRCNFDAFSDPRVERLNGSQYKRWMLLVALSMRGAKKGVVTYLDDEIAYKLNVSVRDWRDLAHVFTQRELLLVRAEAGQRLLYAVAPWFLPMQNVSDARDATRLLTEDGRNPKWWDEASATEASLTLLDAAYADDADEPQTGKTPNAERTFLSKWRTECRTKLNYLPSDAEERKRRRYYHAYRDWKAALCEAGTPPSRVQEKAFEDNWYATPEPAPAPHPTPPLSPDPPLPQGLAEGMQEAAQGTGAGEKTAPSGNTDAPQRLVTAKAVLPLPVTDLIQREKEKDENNSNTGAEPLPLPNEASLLVTEDGNTKTIIFDSVSVYEELTVLYGFSKSVAEQYRKAGTFSEAHLREKMRWISIEYPGQEPANAGKLRNYIEGKWEASSRVLLALQKVDQEQQTQEARRKRAEQDAQEQARLRDERRRQAQRDTLWQQMTLEEREDVEAQAFAQLQQTDARLVTEYVHKPADRKRSLIIALMQPHKDALLEAALVERERVGVPILTYDRKSPVPRVDVVTATGESRDEADAVRWAENIERLLGD